MSSTAKYLTPLLVNSTNSQTLLGCRDNHPFISLSKLFRHFHQLHDDTMVEDCIKHLRRVFSYHSLSNQPIAKLLGCRDDHPFVSLSKLFIHFHQLHDDTMVEDCIKHLQRVFSSTSKQDCSTHGLLNFRQSGKVPS